MSDCLPEVPNKRYFTIGEVSRLCLLKPHVLRYWEQEFEALKPTKRRGRRYYRHEEVMLVRRIRHLLYQKGFTIQGAKAQLEHAEIAPSSSSSPRSETIQSIIFELESIMAELQG